MSLVSVWGRNWSYLCGRIEGFAIGEIVEIASIHVVFTDVAEKMVGYGKRLGEYPTLSARIFAEVLRLAAQLHEHGGTHIVNPT